jgi:hypothetical protein
MSQRTETHDSDEQRHSGTFTDRTHKAGGVCLLIAGVIGAIVGLSLLFGAASITVPFLGGASGIVLAALGVVVLIFSIIEFGGGVAAYEGRSWYGSMIGGILGMVTFFTLPLDIIGTLLIALGEGQFATESGEEPAERE